jgi:crotonobetainyl-CoA:carnitine CoA-transferase CaiB-like acyl-CoA transferase
VTLPPFGLADGLAGMAGAFAIMCALRDRERRTGRGQIIDLALLEPLLMVLGPAPTVFDQLGIVPGRHGNRSPNNSPRNTYQTRDGRWVAVSSSSQTIAERVMRLIGHPEVVDEPWFASAGQRVQHADLLDDLVGSWIGEHGADHVVDEFERAGGSARRGLHGRGSDGRSPCARARGTHNRG